MVLHSAENSMNKACCGLGAFLVLNLPNFRHTSKAVQMAGIEV